MSVSSFSFEHAKVFFVLLLLLSSSSLGIARGCGWQDIGAYANLGSYYLVGIPIAVALGFLLNLKGIGLWIGILTGSTVQVILLGLITSFTNWQKQVSFSFILLLLLLECYISHIYEEFYYMLINVNVD